MFGAVILSGVARAFVFPAICAGAGRSRRTSLRLPPRSLTYKVQAAVSASGTSSFHLADAYGFSATIAPSRYTAKRIQPRDPRGSSELSQTDPPHRFLQSARHKSGIVLDGRARATRCQPSMRRPKCVLRRPPECTAPRHQVTEGPHRMREGKQSCNFPGKSCPARPPSRTPGAIIMDCRNWRSCCKERAPARRVGSVPTESTCRRVQTPAVR